MRNVLLCFGIPIGITGLIGLTMFKHEGMTENMLTTTGGCMLFALLIGTALISSFSKKKVKQNANQTKKVVNKKINPNDAPKKILAVVNVVNTKTPLKNELETVSKEKAVNTKIKEMMQQN